MRKFKVLKCPQVKIVTEMKRIKTEAGFANVSFSHEIKAGEKDRRGEIWYPGAYGHRAIKEGDILEIGGHLADKAAANPQFEEVKDAPVKRKPGRPRKVKVEEKVSDAA